MNEIYQYYKILELEPEASLEEVKKAYRDLVKVWHPDRFSDNQRLQKKANEKLGEINAAYKKIILFIKQAGPLRHKIMNNELDYIAELKKLVKLSSEDFSIKNETKKCSKCSETIKLEAKRCRFCGEIFGVNEVDIHIMERQLGIFFENETKKCPFCAEYIRIDAKQCEFCKEIFEPIEVEKQIEVRRSEILVGHLRGITQCPKCRQWDVYKAYIEDGGQGDWCPNCKESLQKMRGEI